MRYENIQRGTEEVGGKTINYRSKWELHYSYYLQWLKENGEIKEWEYEPERYDFIGYNSEKKPFVVGPSYLPDFRVTENNGKQYLVEVKGAPQGLRKLQRMKKYHKEIEVRLVGAAEYNTLKRQVGKLLNWS